MACTTYQSLKELIQHHEGLLERFEQSFNYVGEQTKELLNKLARMDLASGSTATSLSERVADPAQPQQFSLLYYHLESMASLCDFEFTAFFTQERFAALHCYMQREGLQTAQEALLKYPALAYSRLLERQERLKDELLEYIRTYILGEVKVPRVCYEHRLQFEQQLSAKRTSLLRSQLSLDRESAEYVNSPFTRQVRKVQELRSNRQLTKTKITLKLVGAYLDRLQELKREQPGRECFFYDLLACQMRVYPEQIVVKLQQEGFKVSETSHLQDFSLTQ